MYSSINDIILHFSLIEGIGNSAISNITNNYSLSYNELIDFISNCKNINFVNELPFSEKFKNNLYCGLKNFSLLQKEKEIIKKNDYWIITPYDEWYYFLLQEIENKPALLYGKGEKNSNKEKKYCAVVGSREMNEWGIAATHYFLEELEGTNTIIVSGGARGGDAIAHEYSLKINIPTIAIIGSGLNHWYPSQNKNLFKKIVDRGGTLLSPFQTNMYAHKGSFSIRNAIIAGISHIVFIVQAGIKSGTLITARLANEMGRDIAVVSGRYDDNLSIGCNELISQGAQIIYKKEQIKNLLGVCYQSDTYINKKKGPLSINDLILNACKNPQSKEDLMEILKLNSENMEIILLQLIQSKKLKIDILGRYSQ